MQKNQQQPGCQTQQPPGYAAGDPGQRAHLAAGAGRPAGPQRADRAAERARADGPGAGQRSGRVRFHRRAQGQGVCAGVRRAGFGGGGDHPHPPARGAHRPGGEPFVPPAPQAALCHDGRLPGRNGRVCGSRAAHAACGACTAAGRGRVAARHCGPRGRGADILPCAAAVQCQDRKLQPQPAFPLLFHQRRQRRRAGRGIQPRQPRQPCLPFAEQQRGRGRSDRRGGCNAGDHQRAGEFGHNTLVPGGRRAATAASRAAWTPTATRRCCPN